MRQYHLPDGADGCCITSNKSLAYLQLVFTSNWSNFWRAFASRGFVNVSCAFLLVKLNFLIVSLHLITKFKSGPLH